MILLTQNLVSSPDLQRILRLIEWSSAPTIRKKIPSSLAIYVSYRFVAPAYGVLRRSADRGCFDFIQLGLLMQFSQQFSAAISIQRQDRAIPFSRRDNPIPRPRSTDPFPAHPSSGLSAQFQGFLFSFKINHQLIPQPCLS